MITITSAVGRAKQAKSLNATGVKKGMSKKTLMIIGVIAIVTIGYFIWKSKQGNSSGSETIEPIQPATTD